MLVSLYIMAAVDNFNFLLSEILKNVDHWRDCFAAVGIAFMAHKAIKTSFSLFETLKVHFISRITEQNFVQAYGTWAGVLVTSFF